MVKTMLIGIGVLCLGAFGANGRLRIYRPGSFQDAWSLIDLGSLSKDCSGRMSRAKMPLYARYAIYPYRQSARAH